MIQPIGLQGFMVSGLLSVRVVWESGVGGESRSGMRLRGRGRFNRGLEPEDTEEDTARRWRRASVSLPPPPWSTMSSWIRKQQHHRQGGLCWQGGSNGKLCVHLAGNRLLILLQFIDIAVQLIKRHGTQRIKYKLLNSIHFHHHRVPNGIGNSSVATKSCYICQLKGN